MFESVQTSLQEWSKRNDDRAKLQHAYFALAVAVLVVAGLASLVNAELGQAILKVTLVLVAIFVANAVAWALLQSFVLQRLGRRKARAAK